MKPRARSRGRGAGRGAAKHATAEAARTGILHRALRRAPLEGRPSLGRTIRGSRRGRRWTCCTTVPAPISRARSTVETGAPLVGGPSRAGKSQKGAWSTGIGRRAWRRRRAGPQAHRASSRPDHEAVEARVARPRPPERGVEERAAEGGGASGPAIVSGDRDPRGLQVDELGHQGRGDGREGRTRRGSGRRAGGVAQHEVGVETVSTGRGQARWRRGTRPRGVGDGESGPGGQAAAPAA
jgi:hypothetical protein